MKQIEISKVAKLPTIYGTFKIQAFKEGCKEHFVIFTENLDKTPIVRVHSECLRGNLFSKTYRQKGWINHISSSRG